MGFCILLLWMICATFYSRGKLLTTIHDRGLWLPVEAVKVFQGEELSDENKKSLAEFLLTNDYLDCALCQHEDGVMGTHVEFLANQLYAEAFGFSIPEAEFSGLPEPEFYDPESALSFEHQITDWVYERDNESLNAGEGLLSSSVDLAAEKLMEISSLHARKSRLADLWLYRRHWWNVGEGMMQFETGMTFSMLYTIVILFGVGVLGYNLVSYGVSVFPLFLTVFVLPIVLF